MAGTSKVAVVIFTALSCLAFCGTVTAGDAPDSSKRRVIVFVWDGLRPDSVSPSTTPNLWNLSRKGVFFKKHHSTYPTFTMINSSSLNTGSFPDKVGFYGNTVYAPGPSGYGVNGKAVDYNQPVFTEDWNILTTLNTFYGNQLFLVKRLLQNAQDKGMTTAIVGKSGAAFMFDLDRKGFGIDENTVFPESFARELQQAGYSLPKNTTIMWPDITLSSSNSDPTSRPPSKKLSDNVTSDPTIGTASPNTLSNSYMMKVYLQYILPNKKPDISVIWFRDPDTTQHLYGVGTQAYRAALASMDDMIGQLMVQLLDQIDNTDIVIVSDHGHSNVSGDLNLFPLRAIANGATADKDSSNGYSVSGDVRLAQLLFDNEIVTNVYDGNDYSYDPVLSGIMADGTRVYPDKTDIDGSVTGTIGKKYTTRGFKIPPTGLPSGSVVIAANGGSDYLYVPSKDKVTVRKIVTFLQQREEFGAIFVDDIYGSLAGTMPMSTVHLENTAGRNPDIIVSYNFDENTFIQGVKGIEYESMQIYRGMHGSFSPIDVHNTLIAYGPDFKSGDIDTPSGNIDVAPTIANLMGLSLPDSDGRVLYEAYKGSSVTVTAVSTNRLVQSSAAPGLTFYLPTAVLNSKAKVDSGKSRYSISLSTSTVTDSTGKSVTYFDYAKAVRE
ncbi:MAG TPA: alkaline phosphatase family protein [Syntrophales bacterium]|nr:alkaline phosphatase family protein [Syntrophales bacterium]